MSNTFGAKPVAYACRQGADFGKLSESALALICGMADGAIGLEGFDYYELDKISEDALARMAKAIETETKKLG